MKVLVTGAEGYIGAILLPYLAARGIEVTGLDTGYYRDGWLYSDNDERPRCPTIIYKDLRRCTQDDVAGFDAIVHLAELSNDPLGENRPEITRQINYGGSVHLAQLAREQFGPLAREVWAQWGIRQTRDWGEVVYAPIAVGLLHKSEQDRIEDFDNVFDIDQTL